MARNSTTHNAIYESAKNAPAINPSAAKPRKHGKSLPALLGGAVLALTMSFNAAAQDQQDTTPVQAPIVDTQNVLATAAPASVAPLPAADAALIGAMQNIAAHITAATERNPVYNARTDANVQILVDGLLTRVRAGGFDATLFPQNDGLTFLGGSGMTVFAGALQIAIETGRADLVQGFIDAGANVREQAPDTWTPMDYAVISFFGAQASDIDKARSALAIVKTLVDAGAPLSDAANVAKLYGGPNQNVVIDNYDKLALNIVGLFVMEEAGLPLSQSARTMLQGALEAEENLPEQTRLTRRFIEQHGGRLIHQTYTEAYPGGPFPHVARAGDTLVSITQRYQDIIGEQSILHAMSALMRLNNLGPEAVLRPSQIVLIPSPPALHVMPVRYRNEMNVNEIAKQLFDNGLFYRNAATLDEAAALFARINNISGDPATATLPAGQTVLLPMHNDTYGHLPRLTPPQDTDPTRRVDLVIIEEQGGEDYHRRRTYGVAISSNYAINPDYDIFRFFAWREHFMDYPSTKTSAALTALLVNPQNPLRDNLVFSQSMEMSIGRPGFKQRAMDSIRTQRPDAGPELEAERLTLAQLEGGGALLFTAAGNQFANGEGPYKQSFAAVHAPRTYVIGAAGGYPVALNGRVVPAYVMSAYSTGGADVCAPLPYYMGDQQEGTSFSTPLTAGVYRQFSEWYGHRLTAEEIMAAAMMTANRNVLDYNDPAAASRAQNPSQIIAHLARFQTNGAGLPYHARCGAGVLDVEAWQRGLERMMTLKAEPGLDGRHVSHTAILGAPVQTPDENGAGDYVYRFTVPENMTAGKITALLPQPAGVNSDIRLVMPSGFEVVLPRSAVGYAVSTHAGAYEDLQAGMVIELRSDKPLGVRAQVTLRGFAGDNAVALLRNALRADNILPAPLTSLGGQEARFSAPQPPAGGPAALYNRNAETEIKEIAPTDMSVDPDAAPPANDNDAPAPEGQDPNGIDDDPVGAPPNPYADNQDSRPPSESVAQRIVMPLPIAPPRLSGP